MANPEVERNLEAYRRVKGDLDSLYPKGEFVVFAGGALTTHTQRFEDIEERLRLGGWNPRQCVVIRVGDEEESGDILGSSIGP